MPVASNGAITFPIRSVAIDTLNSVKSSAISAWLYIIGSPIGRSQRVEGVSGVSICQRTDIAWSVGRSLCPHDCPCSWKVFGDLDLYVALITLSSLSFALFLVRVI